MTIQPRTDTPVGKASPQKSRDDGPPPIRFVNSMGYVAKREPLEPEVAEIPHYFTQNRWETSIIT
jgi:hypothetical protein